MQKLYSGKTKDVYLADDGNVLLYFKDSVTGVGGDKIDSGANEVIGEVAGKGHSSFSLTLMFFDLLHKAGIPTHFISVGGPEDNTMLVKRARSLNLEVICRKKAWGEALSGATGGVCLRRASASVSCGVHIEGR